MVVRIFNMISTSCFLTALVCTKFELTQRFSRLLSRFKGNTSKGKRKKGGEGVKVRVKGGEGMGIKEREETGGSAPSLYANSWICLWSLSHYRLLTVADQAFEHSAHPVVAAHCDKPTLGFVDKRAPHRKIDESRSGTADCSGCTGCGD